MDPRSLLTLVIIGAIGCAERREPARPPGDTSAPASATARIATPESLRAFSAPSAQALASDVRVDSAAVLACERAASIWRGLPGARVSVADTMVRPGDVLGDSILSYQDRGDAVAACVVRGHLAQGADSVTRAALTWRAADGRRGRDGWGAVWRLGADGPDGFVETYQRGRTRCQVRGQQDAGDDGDSMYVPDPVYSEEIVCWRHGRELFPVDTAQRDR